MVKKAYLMDKKKDLKAKNLMKMKMMRTKMKMKMRKMTKKVQK